MLSLGVFLLLFVQLLAVKNTVDLSLIETIIHKVLRLQQRLHLVVLLLSLIIVARSLVADRRHFVVE